MYWVEKASQIHPTQPNPWTPLTLFIKVALVKGLQIVLKSCIAGGFAILSIKFSLMEGLKLYPQKLH